jgi:hypothetical protein
MSLVQKFRKPLVIFLVILILGFILLLLRGDEDTWLCVNGVWIKHGVPSAPQPTTECK